MLCLRACVFTRLGVWECACVRHAGVRAPAAPLLRCLCAGAEVVDKGLVSCGLQHAPQAPALSSTSVHYLFCIEAAPQCLPPAPQRLPPAPQRLPPAPQRLRPAPQRLPPAPQRLRPAPQRLHRGCTTAPAPYTTAPAPCATACRTPCSRSGWQAPCPVLVKHSAFRQVPVPSLPCCLAITWLM